MHRPGYFELFKNLGFYKLHHRQVDLQICDTSYSIGNSLSLMAFLKSTQKNALEHMTGLSSSLISTESAGSKMDAPAAGSRCLKIRQTIIQTWRRITGYGDCEVKRLQQGPAAGVKHTRVLPIAGWRDIVWWSGQAQQSVYRIPGFGAWDDAAICFEGAVLVFAGPNMERIRKR